MLYLRLLVAALFASVRARRDLVLENLALRHQLAVSWGGKMSRGPLILVMEAAQDGSALHSAKSQRAKPSRASVLSGGPT